MEQSRKIERLTRFGIYISPIKSQPNKAGIPGVPADWGIGELGWQCGKNFGMYGRFKMRKQGKILKIIWWVYIALLLVFVVVKFKGSFYELTDRISTYSMQGSINYNLIPFRSMSTQIKYITQWWALKNLLGNIIPFIPFGFLLPIAYKKFSSTISVFFTGLASILLIEIFQFLTKLGTFDVDDIILNMIGIVCGYLMFLVIKRFCVREKGL